VGGIILYWKFLAVGYLDLAVSLWKDISRKTTLLNNKCRSLRMVVCPKCGNETSEFNFNCSNCRINLQWAFEDDMLQEESIIFGFNKEGILRVTENIRIGIIRLMFLLIIIGILGAIFNSEKSILNPFGIPFPRFLIITGGILYAVIVVLQTILSFHFWLSEQI
jgi:hypothetical protein